MVKHIVLEEHLQKQEVIVTVHTVMPQEITENMFPGRKAARQGFGAELFMTGLSYHQPIFIIGRAILTFRPKLGYRPSRSEHFPIGQLGALRGIRFLGAMGQVGQVCHVVVVPWDRGPGPWARAQASFQKRIK